MVSFFLLSDKQKSLLCFFMTLHCHLHSFSMQRVDQTAIVILEDVRMILHAPLVWMVFWEFRRCDIHFKCLSIVHCLQHSFIGFSIESRLLLSPSLLFFHLSPLLVVQYRLYAMFLQLLKHNSLPVDRVSVGEGEVVHAFVDFSILISLFIHLFFVHEHRVSFHKGILLEKSVSLFML